ncbi:hypothetical protein NFI96_006454 [Prochilodus magdalenae]|nr:hypothetical protein NFI96_006454 [Prochilodus magdalenae]
MSPENDSVIILGNEYSASYEAAVALTLSSLTRVPVCMFNQTDVCYGAVGHPLYLQLEPEYELTLKKKHNESVTERIFKINNQHITQNHKEYPRDFGHDPQHNSDDPVDPRDLVDAVSTVFVSVWVLEMMVLMSMLGGFHIYAIFYRKRTEREGSSLLMIPECRFAQTDLCYGAVGHPLYLQLGPEYGLILKKIINETFNERIFKFRNKKILHNPPEYPRWQLVPDNRTVIISSSEKRDSGTYILDTYDSEGRRRGSHHLQLVTEDAMSSVEVSYSCSSSEKRRIYCSSDGEGVTYNWTFRGTPHTDQPADGNQTLLLDKESVGSVTCYAQNHVSRGNKTIELHQCAGTVFVRVWVLEMMFLMSVLGGFHIYARIRRNQIKREEEAKEKVEEEALYTNIGQEEHQRETTKLYASLNFTNRKQTLGYKFI